MVGIFRNDNKNTAINSDPFDQCFSVGTNTIQVLLNSSNITGWAGQRITIPIEAIDELGNPAGALTRFSLNSSMLHVCQRKLACGNIIL